MSIELIEAVHQNEIESERAQSNIILNKEDFYNFFLYNPNHLHPISSNGRYSAKTKLNDGASIIIFIQ